MNKRIVTAIVTSVVGATTIGLLGISIPVASSADDEYIKREEETAVLTLVADDVDDDDTNGKDPESRDAKSRDAKSRDAKSRDTKSRVRADHTASGKTAAGRDQDRSRAAKAQPRSIDSRDSRDSRARVQVADNSSDGSRDDSSQ